jgi:hypothetical protein
MAAIALLAFSCKEEILMGESQPATPVINTVYFDINNLSDGPISTQGARPHKLGPDRTNPLTVEVLNRAEAIVYGNRKPSIQKDAGRQASDLYVKFTPRTVGHLLILEESDLFLLDFPLTQQLFEYGDYYEPLAETADYPDLYTTVSVHASLPSVPYTVIDDLDLMESDPRIIQKAFELTGNEQEFIDTYGENFTGRIDLRNACTYVDDEGNVVIIDPSCEIPPSEPGGGSSRYTTNDCGCKIFKDTRKPGGTVKVEDTQFNDFQGVRRVEVVAKNGWFTSSSQFSLLAS